MWNTKGFGPQAGKAGQNEYRLYVDLLIAGNETVLNQPEAPCTDLPCEVNFNSPNEKIVDGGQNKEGWGLIAVAAAMPNLLGGTETGTVATATGGSLSRVQQ